MKQLFYIFLAIVLLSTQKTYANNFIKYTSKNGLSIDIVDYIIQDNEGYIYLGTPNGLNIFNGSSFKVYNSKNTENFTDQVKVILPLNEEIILIGSLDKGIFIYNKLNGSIKPLSIVQNQSDVNLKITALEIDNHFNVWVGTLNNGLIKIPLNQILQYNPKDKIELNTVNINFNKNIKSLVASQNSMWIGTQKNGLFKIDLNKKNNSFEPVETSFKSIWDIKHIDNKLYVAQNGGLEVIDLTNGKRSLLLTHQSDHPNIRNVITSITTDHKNKIWFGTLNDGVYLISLKTNKIIDHYINNPSDSRTININKVLSTYLDNNGNLWLGTWYGGVNMIRLSDNQFKNFKFRNNSNDLSKNIVWSITTFIENKYVLGMNGNGICTLNQGDSYFEQSNFLKDVEYVETIFWDEKLNDLWVGTWENGLIKFDIKSKQMKNLINAREGQLRIHELTKDKHDVLWVGTNTNGLYSIVGTNNKVKRIPYSIFPNYRKDENHGQIDVRKILNDVDNSLWIGSLNHGLIQAKTDDKGNILNSTQIPIELSLNRKFHKLRTLYKEEGEAIWIGYENGLVKYNVQTKAISEILPFRNHIITGITKVSNNEIWISSYSGLYKYEPSTGKIDHFFRNEIITSIFEDKKIDQLWLTTNSGVYSFKPNEIIWNLDSPKIILSDLNDDNEKETIKLNYRNKVTRDYEDNSVQMQVSTLFFGENKGNIIRYILTGYDTDWNKMIGSEGVISYKNLPSGNYKLKIESTNNYFSTTPSTSSLNITILPPWWASFYAYVIYGITIFFITLLIKYEVSKNNKMKILKISRKKDNELNDLKLSFFTNISHEIRTPLTLIVSPIDNLLTKDIKGSWVHQQHQIIYKNANLLLKLVNQILDFRKFDVNKMKLNSTQVDIEYLINNCINQFENLSNEKGIKILLTNTISDLDLWVDIDKMEKVFINLISNAIKYSNHQKNIIVKIEKSSNKAIIKVINFGLYIKPTEIEFLFERFYQSKFNHGGSGIGLSIVKSIIDLHQGEISVKSKLNKETQFIIKLPLGKEHRDEDQMTTVHLPNKPQQIRTQDFEVMSEKKDLDKVKDLLLVIEDNDDIRNYLSDTLKKDYDIVTVNNGQLGIEKATILIPSLIICDIMMDGIDGFEVCKNLKSNLDTSHVPIILLTAKNSEKDKISGYQHGADEYITKPFNMNLLATRIRNLLDQRKLLKEKLNQPTIEPKLISPTSMDEKFMIRAMEVVEKNIENNLLSIEDVASEMKMSQTQFYRKIKNLTGYSASKFIQVVRLKTAAKLLSTKKFKIAEVVYKVGFSSPSYFTKCFKNHFGKIPKEFMGDNR